MVTAQLTDREAPGASLPIAVEVAGFAVQPAGRSSVADTLFAVGPLRLATVPVTVKVSPPRAGLAALPLKPSISTSLGWTGGPQVLRFQPEALAIFTGTPPRTVPRLVSDTFSRPLPDPPALVTARASVFCPSGLSTPLGITNVCWGPTS